MTDIVEIGFSVDSSEVVKADKDVEGLNKEIDANTKKSKKNKDQSDKTNKAVGALGRKAGQAGIQFQQFAGQLEGGVNPMVALSQQGADLGFVLGFPLAGAVAGLGASLVNFLIPSLFGAEEQTASLLEEIESLTDGFKDATRSQIELFRIDSVRRQAELTSEIEKQKEELADLRSEYVNLEKEGVKVQIWGLEAGQTIDVASFKYAKLNEEIVELSAEIDLNTQKLNKEREALDSVTAGLGLTAEKAKSLAEILGEGNAEKEAFKIRMANFRAQQEWYAELEANENTIRNMIIEGERAIIAEQQRRRDIAVASDQERGVIAGMILDLETKSHEIRMQQLAEEEKRQKDLLNFRLQAAHQAFDASSDLISTLAQLDTDATIEALSNTKGLSKEQIKVREEQARKEFENNKRFQKGMVGINTAAAVMMELATNPNPIAKWFNVAGIVASGIKQAAVINSQQFGGFSSSVPSAPSTTNNNTTTQSIQNNFNISGGDPNAIAAQIQELFDSGQMQIQNGSVISV